MVIWEHGLGCVMESVLEEGRLNPVFTEEVRGPSEDIEGIKNDLKRHLLKLSTHLQRLEKVLVDIMLQRHACDISDLCVDKVIS